MSAVMAVPPRSAEQRMESLAQGNEVRMARAAFKQTIRDRPGALIEAIEEPPEYLLTAKVEQFLRCVPGLGTTKSRRVLRRAGVSPAKTMGGLSFRQRVSLRAALEQRIGAFGAYDFPREHDPDQFMPALATANRTRFYRADVKRAIASLPGSAGRAEVLAKLDDPMLATMPLGELLGSIHGVGPSAARKICAEIGAYSAKQVGSLTARQVHVLREVLS